MHVNGIPASVLLLYHITVIIESGLAMAKPSLLSLSSFFFVLCLSLVACSQYPLPKLELETKYSADHPALLRATATFDDLLNLLGTPEQAASVDSQVAQQLKSCFKYLVPPLSANTQVNFSNPIEMVTKRSNVGPANDDNEQVWFGPDALQQLVRLAIDSGGNPQTIQSALDPTRITVPDVEGSTAARCELTRTPTCLRFISQDLNTYQNFLFNLIVSRGPNVGLNAALNRFDFFHGHLFLTKDARIGILYHAKEYPAQSSEFPFFLGYCQTGSTVQYVESQMNLRNILWLAPYISGSAYAPGTLLVLDARPNGIIYRDLIYDDPATKLARTIYEGNFGNLVVDSNYLNVVTSGAPNYQLYIC